MNTTRDSHKFASDAIKDWIIIKIRSGNHVKIWKNDVFALEAYGNCTNVHTSKGKYCITRRMGILVSEIAYPSLLKVHKSYYINIDKIEEN